MTLLLPVLVLVFAGVLIVVALVHSRRETRRVLGIWRQWAQRRGYRFVEAGSSWWTHRPATIEAAAEHAIVLLDTFVVSNGKTSTTYTRARARFVNGGGPRFDVYEEGVLSALGKALGAQDATLGVEDFDAWFVVKTEDVEATRLAWSTAAQRRMRTALPNARARSDGRQVEVQLVGFVEEPRVLEALIALTAELAAFGARELAELFEALSSGELVPARGGWQTPSPAHVVVEWGTVPVELTTVPVSGGLGLWLTARPRREVPDFELTLARGEPAEEPPRGLLDEMSARELAQLDDAVLSHRRGRLRIAFDRWPEVEQVERAIALLSQLVGSVPSVGAFR